MKRAGETIEESTNSSSTGIIAVVVLVSNYDEQSKFVKHNSESINSNYENSKTLDKCSC